MNVADKNAKLITPAQDAIFVKGDSIRLAVPLAISASLSVALVTSNWPDGNPWAATNVTAAVFAAIAIVLAVFYRKGWAKRLAPWLLFFAVLVDVWEVTTAKLGLLPVPPPQALWGW